MPVVKKGLLFDVTRCVGCGACYQACKERNHLPPTGSNFLEDRLSAQTYTVVQSRNERFVRRLCMHCEVPTCASVCPVAALEKTPAGPVVYHEDRCIGCRYCMVACPLSIPRYEWSKVLPRVRKCDLCASGWQTVNLLPAPKCVPPALRFSASVNIWSRSHVSESPPTLRNTSRTFMASKKWEEPRCCCCPIFPSINWGSLGA